MMEFREARFGEVVDEGARAGQAITGFVFTEGLAWHPYEKHLTFSDIRGGKMFRWERPLEGDRKTCRVFRSPSHKANGNTYDREGRLLTCEHVTSRVTRLEPDGSSTVIASHFEGKELNSPNDIVVKSDGRIYFTDPPAGRSARSGVPRPQDLDFQGFFRVDPDCSNLTCLGDDFTVPNGLCFSLDESRLFVNDTRRDHIRIFGVTEDGGVTGGDVWAETTGAPGTRTGRPDGMKVDSEGRLYCTGPGGVHVFDENAVCLGVIHTPEQATNFTWAGEDMCTMFISACTSLYRVSVKVPGVPLF